ncbi:membrane-bound lytic murein transglycosylase B [Leucobacter luti]|uniref:Membrane-bound lytic murein transglycosylase B n=1 Tax=Leucobacter luti TaxID=340320 RepID=A0A4Q7TXL7_9MICO|nr:membrane-bound lytic murein transglycosylase B [Leucobacter luti]
MRAAQAQAQAQVPASAAVSVPAAASRDSLGSASAAPSDPGAAPGTADERLAWLLRGLEYDGEVNGEGIGDGGRESGGREPRPRRARWRTAVIGGLALAAVAVVGIGAAVIGGADAAPAGSGGATETDPAPAAVPPAEPTDATDAAAAAGDVDAAAAPVVDPVWAADLADRAGIPEPAMLAYAGAALTLSQEQPGCGIGWNTLAAIGYVETHHGTIGGARLDDDGRALPRILGVPLDGVAFDAIADTDGGRLDGDADWDRAVGPMQFIPQTWADYGRSASGGVPDIDRIEDAALSAATMLCTIGGDVRVPENWIAAVNAYNPSVAYNNDVADAADHYAGLA